MTSEAVRASLSRAAKRSWPKAAKANDLPFPDFWKGAAEWLCFHAPHVGDGLMQRLIDDVVREAALAEAAGTEPRPYRVSSEVRAIWAQAEQGLKAAAAKAARPAEASRPPMTSVRRQVAEQGRLL